MSLIKKKKIFFLSLNPPLSALCFQQRPLHSAATHTDLAPKIYAAVNLYPPCNKVQPPPSQAGFPHGSTVELSTAKQPRSVTCTEILACLHSCFNVRKRLFFFFPSHPLHISLGPSDRPGWVCANIAGCRIRWRSGKLSIRDIWKASQSTGWPAACLCLRFDVSPGPAQNKLGQRDSASFAHAYVGAAWLPHTHNTLLWLPLPICSPWTSGEETCLGARLVCERPRSMECY